MLVACGRKRKIKTGTLYQMIKLTSADEFLDGQTLILNPRVIISISPAGKLHPSTAKTAIRGMDGKEARTWLVQEEIDVVFSKLKGNIL